MSEFITNSTIDRLNFLANHLTEALSTYCSAPLIACPPRNWLSVPHLQMDTPMGWSSAHMVVEPHMTPEELAAARQTGRTLGIDLFVWWTHLPAFDPSHWFWRFTRRNLLDNGFLWTLQDGQPSAIQQLGQQFRAVPGPEPLLLTWKRLALLRYLETWSARRPLTIDRLLIASAGTAALRPALAGMIGALNNPPGSGALRRDEQGVWQVANLAAVYPHLPRLSDGGQGLMADRARMQQRQRQQVD